MEPDPFSNRATRARAPKNACSIFGPGEVAVPFGDIRPATDFGQECVPRRPSPITLSEEDMKRYGTTFSPDIIVKGMTAGYPLHEVIATL